MQRAKCGQVDTLHLAHRRCVERLAEAHGGRALRTPATQMRRDPNHVRLYFVGALPQ